MGQVLHGSATTTHAIRTAIQRSKAPLKELAAQYGLNQKTVAKWRKRAFVHDARMGPKVVRSTVLAAEEEAAVVAFRKHTLLPLDDCLYALQATIPHLTRSSLHRCLQRHGISRLPQVEGDKPRKAFRSYPLGYFHIDIAEIRTEEGKLHLFVAIDRTSKFAFANVKTAAGFLKALVEAVPYQIHTVLTDNGIHFGDAIQHRSGPTARYRIHMFDRICLEHGIEHRFTKPQSPLDQWVGRAHEPHPQGSHRQALPLQHPPAVRGSPLGLRRCLQLRQTPQDPQRPHAIRGHLQGMGCRARPIPARSMPPHIGTEHLASCEKPPHQFDENVAVDDAGLIAADDEEARFRRHYTAWSLYALLYIMMVFIAGYFVLADYL